MSARGRQRDGPPLSAAPQGRRVEFIGYGGNQFEFPAVPLLAECACEFPVRAKRSELRKFFKKEPRPTRGPTRMAASQR